MKVRIAVLGIVACVGGVAVAGMTRGGPPDPGVVAAHLGAELGLDDATEDRIEAIVAESMKEGAPLRERGEALGEELRGLMDAPQRDWKRIDKLVHEIADLRADGVLLRMKTGDRIEGVLPPDDVPAFRAMQRERFEAEHGPRSGAEGL